MAQILLVEDDPPLAELVSDFLRGHGHKVSVLGRGDQVLEQVGRGAPDAILLDLMLPGLDGLEVCRRLREQGYPGGILMLTARGDTLSEVVGLRQGADDYLAKPVRPQVLLARLEAVLRRVQPTVSELVRGRLTLRLHSREVELAGEILDLSTADFDLLVVMAQHAGEVVSRDVLSQALRGIEWDGLDRSVDLRVSRLRRKLGDWGPMLLKSVRGSGYLMPPEV
ncbi:MAG: DNA-binding response OmpR family regulator [Cognaticolwellia sp.]|jgi:DNA-binding response OmpR family regulator